MEEACLRKQRQLESSEENSDLTLVALLGIEMFPDLPTGQTLQFHAGFWQLKFAEHAIGIDMPGNDSGPDLASLELAQQVGQLIPRLEAAAIQFMQELCKDKHGWELDGVTIDLTDPWQGQFHLSFGVEDHIRFYVGFRGLHPLYVLQRIE